LLNKIPAAITHNVTGIRRFASPYRGFAKQRPGLANCGCRRAWEWRSHDLARRNPEPP